MKKIISFSLSCLAIFTVLQTTASASSYNFSPNPHDLGDLEHGKAYEWIVKFTLPENETITNVALNFVAIYNWADGSEKDKLFIDLFDSKAGKNGTSMNNDGTVWKYTDNVSKNIDFFIKKEGRVAIYTWSDPDDKRTTTNLSIKFLDYQIQKLLDYLKNDNDFSLSFDPDCHYFNNGVSLTITTTTAPVPEPATMLLFGSGLIGFAGIARRRMTR